MSVTHEEVQEYILEKKVREAVNHFVVTRVLPGILALMAIIGVGGWKLLSPLLAVKDNVKELNDKLAKDVEAANKSKEDVQNAINKMHSDVNEALKGTKEKLVNFDKELAFHVNNLNAIVRSQVDIAVSSSRAAGRAEEEFRQIVRGSVRLQDQLADFKAEGQTTLGELKRNLDLQKQALAAHVVDTVTLRSYANHSIKLPRDNGGFHVLQIWVGNIKPSTSVSYRVDAGPIRHFIVESNRPVGYDPVPLGDTSGAYELQPDILFYSAGETVKDFLTFRVRRSKEALQH